MAEKLGLEKKYIKKKTGLKKQSMKMDLLQSVARKSKNVPTVWVKNFV